MRLEDFEKAQEGGLVNPAGPGSVADLNAFLNSPEGKKTPVGPVALPEQQDDGESLPAWFNNTISDIQQAVGNPEMTAGYMRASAEKATAGQIQNVFENALNTLSQRQVPNDAMSITADGQPVQKERFAGLPRLDAVQETAQMKSAVDWLKKGAEAGKDFYEGAQALEKGLDETFPQRSYLGNMAKGVVSSIALQLPTMGTIFLFPELAMPLTASMYATTYGQKYGERRNEQGVDVETAQKDANFQGLVEVGTELGGAYFMGKFWQAAKQGEAILKPFVKELISEYAGESVATALQNGNDFTTTNPADSFADYIFSKQHLSDQVDTLVSTIMQSTAMGVPGKLVQFDTQRRATNYVNQMQSVVTQAKAAGETQIQFQDGTVVEVADLEGEIADITKAFKLDVKSQVDEAAKGVDTDSAAVPAAVEAVSAETAVTPEVVVNEEQTVQSAVEHVTGLEAEAELSSEDIARDPELFDDPTVVEDQQVLATQPDPEFASAAVGHLLGNAINSDNIVMASPELQAFGNYAEDLLISTGTKANVVMVTADELRANPEFQAVGQKLLQRMEDPEFKGAIAFNKGRYLIAVNPTANDAKNFEMVMHEAVGHVIAYEHYDQATPEQKAAIEKDYQKFLKSKSEFAADRGMYPFNWWNQGLPVDEDYLMELQPGTNVGKEWLANQITKWATTNEKPLSLADKWFKALADKFRAAFAKINMKITAVKSVEAWLDSIFDPSRLDSIETLNANLKATPEEEAKSQTKARRLQIKKLKEILDPETLKRYKTGKAVMSTKDEERAQELRTEIKKITAGGYMNEMAERLKSELKKLEGKYAEAQTLLYEAAKGKWIPIKTFFGSSRSVSQRLAGDYMVVHAASAVNLLDGSTPMMSKRVAHYQGLLEEFQSEMLALSEERQQTPKQLWLEFLGNTQQFNPTNLSALASWTARNMDQKASRIMARLMAIAEHNPEALKRAILYKQRVVSVEEQEVAKEEEVLNKELEATEPAVQAVVERKKKVITRKKGAMAAPVSVETLNENSAEPGSVEDLKVEVQQTAARFDQRILDAAKEAIINSIVAQQEAPNLNRISSAVVAKLRLTGRDANDAKKFLKDNWAALSTGQEVVLDPAAAGLSIPDEVSDEEAAAYLDMIDSFAQVRLYRGLTDHSVDPLESRQGYAVFMSASEAVARSYAGEEGVVHPIDLELEGKEIIEFPVKPRSFGGKAATGNDFDMFEFDRRASRLGPNQVLVARNVYDSGPRASLRVDPERRWSYPADLYAIKGGGENVEYFARRKKTSEELKQEKLEATMHIRKKATRQRKPLTEEQIAEKETAKAERRSKAERARRALLEDVKNLAVIAKSKDLSLTEYLSQLPQFTLEQQVKMVRLYYSNFGSVFSQREQIIRLARELGFYDIENGDELLNAMILETFPKSYGTLDSLGIRGRDVVLHKLQKLYFDSTGNYLDFTKAQTLRDFKQEKAKEFEDASAWERTKIALRRVVGRVQDNLTTTPAGSKLVYNLKQIMSAQYSLYSRDYMRKIDEALKEWPVKEEREAALERYLESPPWTPGLTEKETRLYRLMDQIFQTYGMEMERLGFRTYYNSKRQELFKHDPTVRYFPRIWPAGSFERPSDEMIQSLIRSGEAINEEQARKIIHKYGRRWTRLSVPRYANMELARETNMDGWIKDPVEVLRNYVGNGSRRLAVMRVMGPTAEAKLVSLAAEHLRQSNYPSAMEDAVNTVNAVIRGSSNPNSDRETSWLVNEMQAYAVITMLQHSVFLQPGVAANVSSVVGYKNLIKGFSKVMFRSKATRELNLARGYSMGVAERFIAHEMFESMSNEGSAKDRTEKILRSWRMLGLDQWMRAGSALAAESYIHEEIAKAVSGSAKAKKNLKALYIDPEQVVRDFNDNNEEAVNDWIRMGAFTLTQQTNFATDPLTTPKVLEKSSPIMQLLTLFSRYSYHQHKFLADTIKNNPERLLRQIPSTLMMGAPIYLLRLIAKGVDPFKQFEEDGVWATLYKMFMSGSGLGLFVEATFSALAGMTGKGTGGPVGGSIQAGLQNAGTLVRAVANGNDVSEHTRIAAIRGLIDAGIYVLARTAPVAAVPVAAGLGFSKNAIERNVDPTERESKTNWTGR